MDQHVEHKPLQRIEEHEGTILYTDSHRQGVRTLGTLTVMMYFDPATNKYQAGWHQTGYFPSALEALGSVFIANQGMKEAFDGTYYWMLKRVQQNLEGPKS